MTGLECPGQGNTVKNTNVSKFDQTGLIFRGYLCSVIYGRLGAQDAFVGTFHWFSYQI
jgi:hypothetical protein